jgi:hypothetical protein
MTTRKRRFVDAHPEKRCKATITLRDKTTAQCGRVGIPWRGGLCTQHEGIARKKDVPTSTLQREEKQ